MKLEISNRKVKKKIHKYVLIKQQTLIKKPVSQRSNHEKNETHSETRQLKHDIV